MKTKVATILLALMAPVAATSEGIEPLSIDPHLDTVVRAGNIRLVVFHLCSPEHCWSDPYLQWISENEDRIERSVPVKELGYGHLIQKAELEGTIQKPDFRVQVSPSHGGYEPYAALIRVTSLGQYEVIQQ